MKNIIVGLCCIAGLLLSTVSVFAEEDCMDVVKKTKEIYTTLPSKLKQEASRKSGSYSGAYISSYCETAAKMLKQQFGDIAGNMQTLLSSKNLNTSMIRGISNDSLCGNVFYTLMGMPQQDITKFWLILTTFVPNQFANLDDSYTGYFLHDINIRLTYVPQHEGDVMKMIAYSIATVDDNPKENKVFWHPLKLNMLVDFMRGKDITKYTNSRFADFLYLSFDAEIRMCEAKIGKDQTAGLLSGFEIYSGIKETMIAKGYIKADPPAKQTTEEKKQETNNSADKVPDENSATKDKTSKSVNKKK